MELIREARRGDGASLADLILLSDSGLLSTLFAGGPRELIATLAAREGNPFSFRHAWVLESEGEVVGAALGSLAATIRREGMSSALQIARFYLLRTPPRVRMLARAGAATKGLEPTDFYLNNIALFPQWRGRGRGTKLLRHTETEARSAGAGRILLDVDPDNRRAVEFYLRLGYGRLRQVRLKIAAGREFAYERMVKPLIDPPCRS